MAPRVGAAGLNLEPEPENGCGQVLYGISMNISGR